MLMRLQGESGFPHEGEVDFINNQLNPTTGSILMRGVFANPKPPGAYGSSRRGCSSASGCRSASRIRGSW